MNFLNQKPSFAAFEVVTYSASVVESAMIGCLKLFQLTVPPLHMNIYPDVDFLLSRSDINFELVYPSTRNLEPPLKIKNKSLVLLKYLRMFFTAIQYYLSGFHWYLLVILTVRTILGQVHSMIYMRFSMTEA